MVVGLLGIKAWGTCTSPCMCTLQSTMPVSESAGEVFVPKNPPASAVRSVRLKAGPAWIKGYHYANDSDLMKTIEVADGVLKRIDRIAIRMDTVTIAAHLTYYVQHLSLKDPKLRII